jgi:hypothetical protein
MGGEIETIDPNDPHNSVITDIALGPKNANGTDRRPARGRRFPALPRRRSQISGRKKKGAASSGFLH